MLVPESWRNTQAVEAFEELKAGALAFPRVESARYVDPDWIRKRSLDKGAAEVDGASLPT